jgi:hypothetical protein
MHHFVADLPDWCKKIIQGDSPWIFLEIRKYKILRIFV